jgi:L-ascorbate metabolism protein UlaG (beta-lactamase superfamily)
MRSNKGQGTRHKECRWDFLVHFGVLSQSLFLLLPSSLFLLLAVGCASATKPAAPPPNSVRIEWLGHNCFLVTSALGVSVLLDPYETKYFDYPARQNLRPDIILISSEQPQVSNDELAANSPQVFRDRAALGHFSSRGLSFHGVSTSAPNAEEPNVAFVWRMDGVVFCHVGLPSGPLTASVAEEIGRVDVFFLPVGNPFLLTDAARNEIVAQLAPRVVVPMSYANARTTRLGYAPPDAWLAAQRFPVQKLDTPGFTLTRKSLPSQTTVILPAVP